MEKLPPEMLMGIWQRGKPLDKACLEFCDAEYVKDYQKKSISPKGDSTIIALSRVFELSQAEKHLKENLAEKLISGDLIGLGFIPPMKIEDFPCFIPVHAWSFNDIDKNSSSLFKKGVVHFERIRVVKSTDLPQTTLKDEQEKVPPSTKVESRKVGRPSVEEAIISTYTHLKGEGKIDYSQSFQAHHKLLVDSVLAFHGVEVSDKTLHKYLGTQFKADKKSIN